MVNEPGRSTETKLEADGVLDGPHLGVADPPHEGEEAALIDRPDLRPPSTVTSASEG